MADEFEQYKAKSSSPVDEFEQYKASNNNQPESLLSSIGQAPLRIASDLIDVGLEGIKAIPSYYEKAKTEIPGIFKPSPDPLHTLLQKYAGGAELLNGIRQIPKDLSNYATNRLHLLPEKVNEIVEKYSPKDYQENINQLFGEPKYPGEALSRGTVRNALSLSALTKVPSLLNVIKPKKTANMAANKAISNIQENYFQKGIKPQKEAYDKFMKPYGDKLITESPVEFLGLENKQIKALYPTADKLYKNFIEKPSPNNLHNFQSQVGKDIYKTNDEYLKQVFGDVQKASQQKLEEYAKSLKDPEAYKGLLEGKRLTRDVVKPFESTPNIRKIAQKNVKPNTRTFEEVLNTVNKAIESGRNIIDPITGEVKYKIKGVPDNHYLNEVQKELISKNKLIDRRKMYRNALWGLGGLLGVGGGAGFIKDKFFKD